MKKAGIDTSQPYATPKGLRHGFGVHAIGCDMELDLLQDLLGHAQISTTTIYTKSTGKEKRSCMTKVWE